MEGGDSLKLLERLISKEWLETLAVLALGTYLLCRTNLLHRFGIGPIGGVSTKENTSPINGAQKVEEAQAAKVEEVPGEKAELTFTEKMKSKSNKIVKAAEHGEKKQTIENCKKFLSSVEATHFECKIFIDKFEGIEGVENFQKVVENIGKQLKLPDENVEGIKLSALGESRKRDYLAFNCAMKDKGKVRLHTGGYQVIKQGEKIDIQIVLNYMDMSDIILKKLPEKSAENLENKWFNTSPSIEYQKPDEGEDWNSYFQYTAHKNILKELHDVD
eukprot:GFUD01068547.1.p1 GENE.GFUD01068547.1~~GFUD01068547.1.p1  ORF type:complete len:296 (-),score=79.21 GFUD01068547.1:44-865(-)